MKTRCCMQNMTLDSRCWSHLVQLNFAIALITWRSSELTWIWRSRPEVMSVREKFISSGCFHKKIFFLVQIDLSTVKDDWIKTGGPFHVRKVAEHYKIYEHLFGKHAFFTPRVSLDIKFKISDDVFCPVYNGNVSSMRSAEFPVNQVVFPANRAFTSRYRARGCVWPQVLDERRQRIGQKLSVDSRADEPGW